MIWPVTKGVEVGVLHLDATIRHVPGVGAWSGEAMMSDWVCGIPGNIGIGGDIWRYPGGLSGFRGQHAQCGSGCTGSSRGRAVVSGKVGSSEYHQRNMGLHGRFSWESLAD